MDIVIEDLKYENIDECFDLTMSVFNEHTSIDEVKDIYKKCYDNKEAYRFLVAKVDGRVVGYTTCTMSYNLFDGKKPFMTLWYVCTHPEYRKKGIATKMFKAVDEIAIQNNCELIYFYSSMKRVDAHRFYESMGYNSTDNKAFVKFL